MTEIEHQKIVNKLTKKYVGKYVKSEERKDIVQIIGVYVDYRETHQFMNRLEDEYGGTIFIDNIEKVIEVRNGNN